MTDTASTPGCLTCSFKSRRFGAVERSTAMMRVAYLCGIFLSIVVLSTACSDSRVPTAPTAPPPTTLQPAPVPQPPLPPGSFPPVSTTGRIYDFSQALYPYPPPQDYTRASRFVLGEDGTFVMQIATHFHGGWTYRGIYQERDGVITFAWQDWSEGAATGTLAGDTLTVRYNLFMMWTDFEDAIYRRAP